MAPRFDNKYVHPLRQTERNAEIIALWATGQYTQPELAARFGVTQQRISALIWTTRRGEDRSVFIRSEYPSERRPTRNRAAGLDKHYLKFHVDGVAINFFIESGLLAELDIYWKVRARNGMLVSRSDALRSMMTIAVRDDGAGVRVKPGTLLKRFDVWRMKHGLFTRVQAMKRVILWLVAQPYPVGNAPGAPDLQRWVLTQLPPALYEEAPSLDDVQPIEQPVA